MTNEPNDLSETGQEDRGGMVGHTISVLSRETDGKASPSSQ